MYSIFHLILPLFFNGAQNIKNTFYSKSSSKKGEFCKLNMCFGYQVKLKELICFLKEKKVC